MRQTKAVISVMFFVLQSRSVLQLDRLVFFDKKVLGIENLIRQMKCIKIFR